MKPKEIAGVLAEVGTLLELEGENTFKVRAYQAGARAVENLSEEELARRLTEDSLAAVKGIGVTLAGKIAELRQTGRLAFHAELRARVPDGVLQMLEIPGLGPKKVRALREGLGIQSLAALAEACRSGAVAELPGFGATSQQKILDGIANRERYGRRRLWVDAWETARPVLEALRARPDVQQAEVCGSLRRRLETVGDLDFLVATATPQSVADWFVALPGIGEVTAHGETKVSVRFDTGLQADLRLVPPEVFPFALHHFTGSMEHNVLMRQRALSQGLSLSEWGLFPADAATPETPGARAPAGRSVESEAELFAALGLAPIPPELREGRGEIEAAEKGELPRLVEEGDIRGVFHNHTTASDGANSLEEMVAAAEALGLEYIGIADHSQSSVQARGLDAQRLREQVRAIAALNAAGRFRTHIFAGTECDILADGRLDFDGDLLGELDYVVVSVHASLGQNEEEMTRRIVRAIEHPRVTMLGHLTGRLLTRREGAALNVERVIDAAIAHGVMIELNANPRRLELDWRYWRKAAARGLLCCINPDAHTAASLAHYRLGVGVARKGWLTKEQVFNTRGVADVQRWLAARRQA